MYGKTACKFLKHEVDDSLYVFRETLTADRWLFDSKKSCREEVLW
jgi:hypothetical protein